MQNVYVKQFHHFNNKCPTNFAKNSFLIFKTTLQKPRFKRPVSGTPLWYKLPPVSEKGIQDHSLFNLKVKENFSNTNQGLEYF